MGSVRRISPVFPMTDKRDKSREEVVIDILFVMRENYHYVKSLGQLGDIVTITISGSSIDGYTPYGPDARFLRNTLGVK